jgi:Protein of unknown function (DUF2800)
MGGQHSVLSPSSASRWMQCPGSVALTHDLGSITSVDAASGTLTHRIAETVLRRERTLNSWLGQTLTVDGFEFTVDQDRIDRAKAYVDAIERETGVRHIEVKLDLSGVLGVPDQGGTADCVIVDAPNQVLQVHDLKDGVGIVYAKDNKQLLTYAAGALAAFELYYAFREVKVAIHQPRVDHYDEHTYSVTEVLAHAKAARAAAQTCMGLIGKPKAEIEKHLSPSDAACRWCPVRGSCSARMQAVIDMFPIEPEPMPQALDMTPDRIAYFLSRADEIENCVSDVRKQAAAMLRSGQAVPGFKLVQGRQGPRKWIDAATAERVLVAAVGDRAYAPRELITATVAEKVLKKEHKKTWDDLQLNVARSEGSLSVVPEADSRAPVNTGGCEFGLEEVSN